MTRSPTSSDADGLDSTARRDRAQRAAQAEEPQTARADTSFAGDYARDIELLTVSLPRVLDTPPPPNPLDGDSASEATAAGPDDHDPPPAPSVKDLLWELEQRAWGADR